MCIRDSPDADALAKRLADATIKQKYWEDQKLQCQLEFKRIVGDAIGIRSVDPGDWLFSWKSTKSNGTDWQGLAKSLGATRVQEQAFQRPGYRKIRFVSRSLKESPADMDQTPAVDF